MEDTTRPDAPTPGPETGQNAGPASQSAPPPPPQQSLQFQPQGHPMSMGAPPPTATRGGFKRGFGLGAGAGLGVGAAMIAVSLVASVLTGLVMLGFAGAVSSVAGAGQTAVEPLHTVWGPASATKQLRAIPVVGAIQTQGDSGGLTLETGTFGYEVADVLDGLSAEDADAIVLMLDTPGGTLTGSRAMADAVDRYRERTGKKVFAFVQGMSASGGLYTMAGADEIVADHGSVVGSVGVILGPLERYRDVTSMGSIFGSVTAGEVTQEYITRGAGKDAGQPFRDLTPQERAELEAITEDMYQDFVSHVATKRGIDPSVIVDELGAGMFTGERAKEVGYIDETMGRTEALRHFATEAGLDPDDTKLVQAGTPGLWASLLGAESRAWGTAPAAQPEGGQPARATARMCVDPTEPLLWHGPLVGVCG